MARVGCEYRVSFSVPFFLWSNLFFTFYIMHEKTKEILFNHNRKMERKNINAVHTQNTQKVEEVTKGQRKRRKLPKTRVIKHTENDPWSTRILNPNLCHHLLPLLPLGVIPHLFPRFGPLHYPNSKTLHLHHRPGINRRHCPAQPPNSSSLLSSRTQPLCPDQAPSPNYLACV